LKIASGMEDKVEESDQTVKDHERMLQKYKWNIQDIRHHEKTKLMNHECRRRDKT
jgi:hypothetical protein